MHEPDVPFTAEGPELRPLFHQLKNQLGIMITSHYNQVVVRPDERRQGAKYFRMLRDNGFCTLADPPKVFDIALCFVFSNY